MSSTTRKGELFLKTCYHTKFQDPSLSTALTSEVYMVSMLVYWWQEFNLYHMDSILHLQEQASQF